jgi:hypothetical protein
LEGIIAYWIYENGETIGPLRREQVLQQAGPGTPVSDGGEWIELGQHPDFAKPPESPSAPPPVPPPASPPEPEQPTAPEVRTATPVEMAKPIVEKEKTPNPEDSDFRRVRRLARATKPPEPEEPRKKKSTLGGWLIVVAGIAITGFLALVLLQSGEAESPWDYLGRSGPTGAENRA